MDWKERERIATNFHNIGVPWSQAWVMADIELDARTNGVRAMYDIPDGGRKTYPELKETETVATKLYYIRCDRTDELSADGVSEPRRILSAARIASLLRKIRSTFPGAIVSIRLPGIPDSLVDFLRIHINDTLVIVTEWGEVEGEPFTPSDVTATATAETRQKSIGEPHPISGWIPTDATPEEGE